MKLPNIVPPLSVFCRKRTDTESRVAKDMADKIFRIGYYSPQDGLDCIWLVNEDGEYCETVDKAYLTRNYIPLMISDETDYYGENRPKIGKLPAESKRMFKKKIQRRS